MNNLDSKSIEIYNKILDIQINFMVILGDIELSLQQILNFEPGSIINLQKPAGESLDIVIGNRSIGRGDIIVYDRYLAVRINEVLDSDEIIQTLASEG